MIRSEKHLIVSRSSLNWARAAYPLILRWIKHGISWHNGRGRKFAVPERAGRIIVVRLFEGENFFSLWHRNSWSRHNRTTQTLPAKSLFWREQQTKSFVVSHHRGGLLDAPSGRIRVKEKGLKKAGGVCAVIRLQPRGLTFHVPRVSLTTQTLWERPREPIDITHEPTPNVHHLFNILLTIAWAELVLADVVMLFLCSSFI